MKNCYYFPLIINTLYRYYTDETAKNIYQSQQQQPLVELGNQGLNHDPGTLSPEHGSWWGWCVVPVLEVYTNTGSKGRGGACSAEYLWLVEYYEHFISVISTQTVGSNQNAVYLTVCFFCIDRGKLHSKSYHYHHLLHVFIIHLNSSRPCQPIVLALQYVNKYCFW